VAKKQQNQEESHSSGTVESGQPFIPAVEGVIMAQNGFAFFFLAVLLGCSISLASWMRLHWAKIAAAVRGDVPQSRPLNYKAVQRQPIEVPYVAQRMLAQTSGSTASQAWKAQPIWAFTSRRPNGHQLAFGF
jgi:hypothetical protein